VPRSAPAATPSPATGAAAPTEATIRRALGRLDGQALATAIGAWLADHDRNRHAHRRQAVTIDGKTLRGARRAPDRRPPGAPARRHAPPEVVHRFTASWRAAKRAVAAPLAGVAGTSLIRPGIAESVALDGDQPDPPWRRS